MAVEEYFLDHFPEESVILWRNHDTVVVGRNQNTLEEINPDYVRDHHISVVRRLTGGGAVFHDLGNINFTVIKTYRDGLFSDYAFFTEPVCKFLQSLGVHATLSGRNDLLINGMKFSGNAQTKHGNRILHHGTLLFHTDAARLAGALKPNPMKIESKSIKSVQSRVTNILPHLQMSMKPEEFLAALYQYFLSYWPEARPYQLTPQDRRAIETLREKKYSTWEWNYGNSPKYMAQKAKKFPFGMVDVRLSVEAGNITSLQIYGDFFGFREITELISRLIGLPHRRDTLLAAFNALPLQEYIYGITPEKLLSLFL